MRSTAKVTLIVDRHSERSEESPYYTINGTTLTLTTANGPLTFSAAVATPAATQ